MAKQVKTIPFSFDELYNESRSLFENAGFDTADGSNTSQLAAVMSYLVASLNTNTALNINETLLPYANKRKNILQDARVLGYEAKHKVSYQYKLTILLSESLKGYGTFTIPKNYTVSANGNTYHSTSEDIVVNLGQVVVNGKFVNPSDVKTSGDKKLYDDIDITSLWNEASNIFEENRKVTLTVKEGELITWDSDVASLERTIDSITLNGSSYVRNYIDIPYNDVEDDGIECIVSYYDDSNTWQENVKFEKTEDYFFELDNEQLTNKFIRIDDIEMETPRVYFKYAGMGKGIPLGSLVRFNILITSGVDGSMGSIQYTQDGDNLSYTGILLPSIASDNKLITNVFSGCVVTSCDLLTSGKSEESNSSIKLNAPKVYNSAYRCVTNLDFKYACNRSTYVDDSVVWGGEDEFPKSPGHVWISLLPAKHSERTFTSNEDNSEYQRDNSILVYNYLEGETTYQHALRNDFYAKNYLLSAEILDYDYTTNKYSGVFGDLEYKRFSSLTLHHRNPLYLNFNYKFNILNYNIKETTSNIHNELFKVLDNCFSGDDLQLEKFDATYFHSNIVKRIDNKISDLCGFTSSLETQVVLNEKTLCTENWYSNYKDIYIPLCVPFEKYFTDDGYLDVNRLPNIDTENFINYKIDDIIEPTKKYDGSQKYSDLHYSVITGDLRTDWSRVLESQNKRHENNLDNDSSVKVFVAPIKIDMEYKYYVAEDFINSSDNYLQLGFNLAPSNTSDESLENITVNVYESATSDKITLGISKSKFTLNDEHRDRLYLKDDGITLLKNNIKVGNIISVRFERTCGYYYLFNNFKKEILIHLFVNGDFEGFNTASTGMRSNSYYDTYLEQMNSTWKTQEKDLTDDDSFIDVTYSMPRSYLYTSDRMYLVSVEPTGAELEEEKHLFNYDQTGLKNDTEDDRTDPEEENSIGHYLTTEGYLIDETSDRPYTGPIVRVYNENMYKYTPLNIDLFKQNVYLNLKYPSENFKLHRNVIPRLNNVKFKNANKLF